MLLHTYLLGLTVVLSYHGLSMAVTTTGRKYTLFRNLHSWNEARNVCITSNMGMLKIDSDAEMKGFKKVLQPWISDGKLIADMWLGLYDNDPTGPEFAHYWQYDCAPLGTYAPWMVNVEPDGKGTENCVRTTKDGVFKTRTCPSTLAVICQENTAQCWFEEYVKKKISNLNLLKSATATLRECKAMCLKATAGAAECVAVSHDGRVCSIYIAESIFVISLPAMTDTPGYDTLVKRCYDGNYTQDYPAVAENKENLAENKCTTTSFSSTTTSTPITASTAPASISPSTTTTPVASISAETMTTTSTSASEATSSMSSSSAASTTTLTFTTVSIATTPTSVSAPDTTTSTAATSTTDAIYTPPAATTSVPISSTVSTTTSTTVSFTVTTSAATTISTSASVTSPTSATTTVTSVSQMDFSLCGNSGSTPRPDNSTCAAICVAIAGPNSLEWQALMRALILNRKMLSSYRRAKTSARDDRPSAGTLGASGIGILVLVFGSLILLDLDRFVSLLHRAFKMPRGNKFKTFTLAKDL
ncbi:spore coat protein SP96-like [Haliotis asinina]|uniref:spore coat protein SP96-like n=1 Tax=Haliotis asinina TaxID=109174 RepID=UPI00353241B9